jgi:uncharacterized surface protein with fasciclin (FAS1) repeats
MMRRIWLFVLSFLGLTLVINLLPVAAQGGSITGIVDSRPDLSTLSAFLDAAPDVRERLNDGHSYTLLAPNDRAFANLVSTLDVSLVDLLGDPKVASAILEYHVLDGSLSSQQIRERSGQVVLTLLHGAFISFRLGDDNTIAVNNLVEIIESDIGASNGTIHIINDVLLNRVIDQLVADIEIGSLITPNSSNSNGNATQEATPETTSAPVEVANLRFAHFAIDAPTVDIYVDGSLVFENMVSGEVSDFSSLIAGNHTLSIQLQGDNSGGLAPIDLDLANASFKTVALMGSFENQPLMMVVIEEDYSGLGTDSRIAIFHALEDAPEIDITFGKDILLENLSFGDSSTVDLSAGSYDLTASTSNETLFEESGFAVVEGDYTLIAMAGTVDDVNILSITVDSEQIQELRQGTMLDSGPTSATPEPSNDQTVLDILKADERFTTFVEALDEANPVLINRLASVNQIPITVLVPTNQAFENLFAAVVQRSQFFRNRNLMTQVLQYHMIDGELLSSDFSASTGTSIITLLQPTQAFFVTVNSDGKIFLNRSVQFEEFDIQASNGVIHVIDDLLLPQVALDAWR